MGLAMANNLQRHLAAKKAVSLLYSNRTMSRGSPLQSLGGIPEPSFDKLVSRCGIIFTMVRLTHGEPSNHQNRRPGFANRTTRSPMTRFCKT